MGEGGACRVRNKNKRGKCERDKQKKDEVEVEVMEKKWVQKEKKYASEEMRDGEKKNEKDEGDRGRNWEEWIRVERFISREKQ